MSAPHPPATDEATAAGEETEEVAATGTVGAEVAEAMVEVAEATAEVAEATAEVAATAAAEATVLGRRAVRAVGAPVLRSAVGGALVRAGLVDLVVATGETGWPLRRRVGLLAMVGDAAEAVTVAVAGRRGSDLRAALRLPAPLLLPHLRTAPGLRPCPG